MPYNSKNRLEREALESLVAADLSAKMKHWRNQSPPPNGRGNNGWPIRLLLVLLALGGAAWLFWPKTKQLNTASPQEQSPKTPPQQQTQLPGPEKQVPITQKNAPGANRYRALAQSNYHSPDFTAEIRGTANTDQALLNQARKALAERRFSDALNLLQNAPADFQTDADYLKGHALFGLNKYDSAAAVFGRLTGSVRYGEAAQWYELLALLPDMDANRLLVESKLKKMVEDEDHTFHKEALSLYSTL